MEITDQDIFDFIKSRGTFTCAESESSPYFYFDPNRGQVWQHNLEIFGIEVWLFHHNGEVSDEMRDNLIKSIIDNDNYKQKILKILNMSLEKALKIF